MDTRQRGPNRFMAQTTAHELRVQMPRMVNSQPLPMLAIRGAPMIPPMHEKMLRTKLFRATPEEERPGMNSVSMVVAMAKISMLPTP